MLSALPVIFSPFPPTPPKASVWKKQKGKKGQARSPAAAETVGEVSLRFEDYCPPRSLGSTEEGERGKPGVDRRAGEGLLGEL